MVEYNDEKDSVDELLEILGTDVIIFSQSTEAYSEDTGWSEEFANSQTIRAAPYNVLGNYQSYQPFGNQPTGSLNLIIKGDQDLKEKDKLLYDSKIYTVASINPLPIGETTLAKLVRFDEQFTTATYVDLTDSAANLLTDSTGQQLQVLEV
jgi:hypothetical protein